MKKVFFFSDWTDELPIPSSRSNPTMDFLDLTQVRRCQSPFIFYRALVVINPWNSLVKILSLYMCTWACVTIQESWKMFNLLLSAFKLSKSPQFHKQWNSLYHLVAIMPPYLFILIFYFLPTANTIYKTNH